MKVSRSWLQRYFDAPLPSAAELAGASTFHAFEVESVEGDLLDLKVLPDRAGYALSHRGIAKEFSAILNVPLKRDPLKESTPSWPTTERLEVTVDPAYVTRHVGALYEGVKVGPSPAWLREALESVGQRSINNVVDVLNFVMLDIGQPAGAFDLATLKAEKGAYRIDVRRARPGEKIVALTGETYTLTDSMFVFTDAVGGSLLDIAGIKGGKDSGVTEKTTDLFISVGNYDPTLLRRASQSLKLHTDASQRYQNRPSPALTPFGMRDILLLLGEVAGGKLVGVHDVSHAKTEAKTVSVTASRVTELLGAPYAEADLEEALTRLGLSFQKKGAEFIVTPPFERSDLAIPEDLVEEVGRVLGYDRVPPKELPVEAETPFTARRNIIEAARELVVAEGYSEVSTYSMLEKGDVELASPLADDKKYLRTGLAEGHLKAIALNLPNLPLFDATDLRLFEVGHVWPNGKEKFALGISYSISGKGAEKKITAELARMREKIEAALGKKFSVVESANTIEFDMHELMESGATLAPAMTQGSLSPFRAFSIYPFVLRDIAIWTPEGTTKENVQKIIAENAGELLHRIDLFDTFTKEGKTSHAFRLVFQSMERTLSDEEVGAFMERVTAALNATPGWQVR